MIQANELRIGNWVELKNSGFIRIDADNIGEIVNNPAILNPIPLTPEILKKCGFYTKKDPTSTFTIYWNPRMEIFAFMDENPIDRINIYYRDVGDIAFLGTRRKFHLHQLQNLYFALTGEELQVQL